MQRFQNILLVHPCDEPTLSRAKSLAHKNHATLTVMHVERELTGTSFINLPDSPVLELQGFIVREYQSQLSELTAPLEMEGLAVSWKVVVGTPFLEIIREVIVEKHDLVIMTAEGKGGLKTRLFGSTSLHLMRKCPCPVWVMKPNNRKPFLRIMAAVDPDPVENSNDELNALILHLASSLAEQDGAELHVVHAWALLGESALRARGRFTESELRGFSQVEMTMRQNLLDALIAKHANDDVHVHLVHGVAEFAITHFAHQKKVDLLVMGTVCRTGIPGFFIGNTAERVLDEVNCSVLTVKPKAFQSPVTFD